MPKGHRIWNLEFKESLQGRFTEISSRKLAKYNLDIV
jgi:hypothetical protein